MDDFRWLLLIFGIFTIFGIYLYSRQQEKSLDQKKLDDRVQPVLSDDLSINDLLPDIESNINELKQDDDILSADIDHSKKITKKETEKKIVTIRIVSHEKNPFPGDELILSMRGIGLRHGKFGIFHHFDSEEEKIIFSVASLVEPGSFDLHDIKNQKIPGISLFLILPTPIDCVDAFDMMLKTARTLSKTLNGELLDETGSTLSMQRERYLREEIIQFQHSKIIT
tara:strand:- start:2903 stop:3577 length:675 start_codon:yes stop_codon:yes gene_type:complete